jgi:PEP-CTERM motif
MAVDGRKRFPEGRRVKQSGAGVGGRMSFPSWASRVASASAVAALVLIAAPAAKADVVKAFDLSGRSATGDTFAGTIDLDFTNDTATSVDVTVDKSSVSAYAYNQILFLTFALSGSSAVVYVADTPGDVLTLFFTVPTPNTFTDFKGGTIAAEGSFGDGRGFLFGATGLITPVTPVLSDPPAPPDPPDPPAPPDPPKSVPVIPEPSTWVMMLLGFVGLGLAAKGRRAVRFLAKA